MNKIVALISRTTKYQQQNQDMEALDAHPRFTKYEICAIVVDIFHHQICSFRVKKHI